MQSFKAGGPGGQNQNARNTGVRIKHVASGAIGEARDKRTQGDNKKAAFVRMARSDKFQQWAKIMALGIHQSVEAAVSRQMSEIEIEYYDPRSSGESGKRASLKS